METEAAPVRELSVAMRRLLVAASVGPLSFKSGMESVGRLGLPLLHGHSIGC